MPLLASDLNNTDYVNPKDPDAALRVRFHNVPVHQAFDSIANNTAIYKDVMYIEISTPGDNLNVVDVPLREDHIQRFRQRWEHFQKHGEESGENAGIPLSKWPILSVSQVEMIRAAKFFTVDQVAAASDSQISAIGMHAGMAPASFRDKARQYLRSLRDNTQLDAENAQNAARDKELADLRERDAKREKQMEDMQAMLEKLTAQAAQGKNTITAQNAKAA